MKTRLSFRLLMALVMFFGTLSVASAADRFYAEAVNFEPGETKTIAFCLENAQEFYGFQADIFLPDGLEIITVNGKPDCTLSSRANSSYALVSNLLSTGNVRVGAFSTNHTPISGNSGALLYVNVHASDSFVGGTLSVSDILFTDAANKDVALPEYHIDITTTHNDQFYIPDFKIAVGETKDISLFLDNETSFTAFQTDIYLPEGLTLVANSSVMTDRGLNHTISAKAFSDGRVRLVCLSLNNTPFTGNSGALVNLQITATKDVAESCRIEMKNQRFSMTNAKEYIIPNSVTEVTTERALVEQITLSNSALSMVTGQTAQLSATVLPTFASTKDIEWSSSNPTIASVSASGLVTAIAPGSVTITASSVDGSGVKATCEVSVSGIPVTAIILNRESAQLKVTETLQLSATVQPANAYDKGLTWSSTDDTIATVDEQGNVTAIKDGTVQIIATSVSNPEISATCNLTVIPTPVSSIVINQTNVSLEVGQQAQLEATVLPETATVKDLVWRSNNEAIATVENGLVTAIALGTTYIYAEATDGSGVTAISNVTVVPTPATGISISTPDNTTFKKGETIQLTAVVTPENATDKSITWTVSDSKVASVSTTGLVTALSESDVTVTATNSAGNSSDVTLTVVPTPAESITITPSNATLRVGQTLSLVATVAPTTTTNKNLVWTSSNTDIISVDENGKVTAIALGKAEVTATAADGSGVKASAIITVEPTPATGITISYSGKKSLYVGESAQLSAEVTPEDATDKSITWQSQNSEILSVDSNGLVTAVGLGEAWISATNSAGQNDLIVLSVIPTPVTSITLNSTEVQLKATETYKLSATVTPTDATDKSLTWSSSNTSVATVDANGYITAVSLGQAVITVSANDGSGVSAKCTVTVIATPVESVSITVEGSTKLKATQTVQLRAEVLPATATNKSVVWTSSNENVATVSADGLVTAKSVGTAVIKASAGSKTAEVTIIVEPTLAESILLNRSTAAMKVTGTMQLTATFIPETTTNKKVTWSSSNSEIASVNSEGLVTANAIGDCIITATATDGSGVKATCSVNVGETSAESITISPKGPFTVHAGDKTQLSATVLPETTTDKSVTWRSENGSVAVDENGLVTAVSVGECMVYATNSAGQIDQVKFTVVPTMVSGITLDKSAIELKATETYKLSATVTPSDATDKSLTWSSSNTSIATVDANGLITAVSVGQTVITVSANDGSGVSAKCTVTVIATPVESVSITVEGSTKLKATQTVQLRAEVLPATATNKSVVWTSSNEGVATVSANGLVTAKGVGTAVIKAAAGSKTAEVTITVEPTLAESLVINRQSAELQVGDQTQLVATIMPSTTTNQAVAWSSSDSEIVSVDSNGLITAKALGNAVITASTTDGTNISAQCNVTVIPTPVEKIEIIYDGPTSLKVGQTAQLSYRIYPENATDKSVEWVTENSGFTVSQQGLVTAHELCEDCWVGVFAPRFDAENEKSDIIHFKCIETPVESISVSAEKTSIKVGETTQLVAIALPDNATNKNVSWSSSNESIATVDQNGLVTGVSVGEVDIKACSTDGSNVYGSTRISVIATPVESIEIHANGKTSLKDGETLALVATVYPDSATDKTVVWNSDNEATATVDQNGVVTAHSLLGIAHITATSNNGVSASIEINVIETPVESIEIHYEGESSEILDGESIHVYASITPSTATNPSIEWSVSNPSIISFENGTVTGIYPGEAYVIATAANGVTASLLVTVKPILVERIEFTDHFTVPLYTDGDRTQVKLAPKIYPENASIKTLHWTSSNESVGMPWNTEDGIVFWATGVGSTTLTCYAEDGSGVTATCDATVIIPLTGVSLNEHEITLMESQKFELVAQIEPIDASYYYLNWTSSNENVATVEDGLIEAISEGECTIEVLGSSGLGTSYSDECNVKVVKDESGITNVSIDDITIKIENSHIKVENQPTGRDVSLYTISGICIEKQMSQDKTIEFEVANGRVYILKCGMIALKIVIP